MSTGMSGWQQLKHALTRPAGFSADGRRVGLGLDTAMDARRREADHAVADIEQYANDRRSQGEETTTAS